ncbi:ABC transporter ATP-binding protein [Bacillus massilinigeriensis]|uniref:ABC transporter ATP-binding protein n=1 Tax=Bacillus massilionigeriensis TaxID=1805475 RepID=UPI00096AF27C|nr:ABC transporter ATP-binding protein [Bacillus massilionigeriensis]
MEKILEIQNLCKNYKDFSLNNISMSLDRGFIMGFIGPNGAGKSTTIKLIMNLISKDSGEIRVFGQDHKKNEIKIKERIGFVYDESHYYEDLTILQMKKIISKFYKKWDDNAFYQYIKAFNLPINKKIKDLSKGMKMKFSLAIALSHHAELLIMDEPTSGLDPLVRSELLDILMDLIQDERKGILFSTHITSDLDKIADYITLIHEGEVILSLPKDEIFEQYGIIKGRKEFLTEQTRKYFIGIKENEYGFEGLVRDKTECKRKFGPNIIVEKPNLEDVMLFYTRGGKGA